MAKKNKNFYSRFTLKNIEIIEQNLNVSHFKESDLDFNLEATQSINIQESTVQVVFSVKAESKNSEECYVHIAVANIFKVETLTDFITNGDIEFPKEYVHLLNELSLSHVRAITMMILSNTPLNMIMIPLVDFSKLEAIRFRENHQ